MPDSLLRVQNLCHAPLHDLNFSWPAGVSWVCGNEGTGKTTLLRLLAADLSPTSGSVHRPAGGVCWIDLMDTQHDVTTANACWQSLRLTYPNWDIDLQNDLMEALDMTPHLDKRLNMLSAGSRRKVMVIAALASGASVTVLDQPFAALDKPSIRILHDFLQEAATHTSRAWIVADYEVPEHLPLARVLNLDNPSHR